MIATTTHQFSVEKARAHARRGELRESLFNYLTSLGSTLLGGEERRQFLPEFLSVFQQFLQQQQQNSNNDEEEKKEEDEIMMINVDQLFELSMDLFAESAAGHYELLRLWAGHYFSQGKLLKSLELFQRALNLAKNDLQRIDSATNLENVRSNLIDSWHWRMLNDPTRNSAFAQAIARAIASRPQVPVLDIGCGSGIYSILAVRSGAKRVFACDYDSVMCAVSRECFSLNGVVNNVEVFESHSQKLEGIPERAGILITETFDCAVFGEGIAATILDARKRLLLEDPILIPSKATILAALIESADVVAEHVFDHHPNNMVIVSEFCSYFSEEEAHPAPYTCNFLRDFPRGYRLLSDPADVFSVDFYNQRELERIVRGEFRVHAEMCASEAGTAHGLAVWFRVSLASDLELCTAPGNGLCWQQAIFPFYPHRRVAPGDRLPFEFSISKEQILFVCPQFWRSSSMAETAECDKMKPNKTIRRESIQKLDILAMNDEKIFAFFRETSNAAIDNNRQVVDCTNLMIMERFNNPSTIQNGNGNSVTAAAQNRTLLFWPFSSRGLLKDDCLASIVECHIRSPTTTLQLVPSRIVLRGCLVTAHELANQQSRPFQGNENPSVHCGANLTPMDRHRTTYFHAIEPHALAYRRLSSTVDLLEISFCKAENDLAQLTQVNRKAQIRVLLDGTCHALLHWFAVFDDAAGQQHSSLDFFEDGKTSSSSWFKVSAYILDHPMSLRANEMVDVCASTHHGIVLLDVSSSSKSAKISATTKSSHSQALTSDTPSAAAAAEEETQSTEILEE